MIVMGLVAAFITAGAIEGFVTGSSLPTAVRVGIGVAVEAAFVTYIVVQGRAAAARGITGVLGEVSRGWEDEQGWDTEGDRPARFGEDGPSAAGARVGAADGGVAGPEG